MVEHFGSYSGLGILQYTDLPSTCISWTYTAIDYSGDITSFTNLISTIGGTLPVVSTSSDYPLSPVTFVVENINASMPNSCYPSFDISSTAIGN